MEFSESNGPWGSIPPWANFFIQMGREWPQVQAGGRRVALISTPCDSAAAGLIVFGALIRDLETHSANDIDAHYDSLLRYARQYLESCGPCDLARCNPQEKRCGYSEKVNGRVKQSVNAHRSATISSETNLARRELVWKEGNATSRPTPRGALRWHIDGHPPTQIRDNSGAIPDKIYAHSVSGAEIQPDNLMRSYSGLCLAGRTAGESQSREICSLLKLRLGDSTAGLDDLLTIFDWTACDVSRVTYYNPRTDKLDRESDSTSLVVADGGDCFLKICGSERFQQSDIIGVAHRNAEREKLEALGDKITNLKQWLMPDEDALMGLPAVPMGVSLTILKRRLA